MGRRFAPYKRFRRRRKPWRRANSLRPSILKHTGPHCVHRTQWETGRRGRVPRHEGFLQPEVSIVPFCKAARPGGFAFSCRPAPRGPILGSPRRAQRSGSSGGRRSKGAQRSFCRRQKRSRADFVTTKGRQSRPEHLKNLGVPIVCHGTQWAAGRHR